jgi:hypothetical protein
VDEAVDHGGSDDVVAEDFTPAAEGLLEVTMRLARSWCAEINWKNKLAASGSNGMSPTSSMISSGTRPSLISSSWSRSPWWAEARRSTHCAAVANATRCPAWQARIFSPIDRCVLRSLVAQGRRRSA